MTTANESVAGPHDEGQASPATVTPTPPSAAQPPNEPEFTPLDYALAYARHQWPVFPCYWITDGACCCGDATCRSPGKHPLTPRGFHDATVDPAQIEAWWTDFPLANIGVATGNGLAAIDFDAVDGEESWPHVVKALRSANTPRSRTGRQDGMHVFLRVPEGITIKSRAGVWPGVDVRGDGGYVIVPPSNHLSGRSYAWINDLHYEVMEMPPELLEMLMEGGASKVGTPSIYGAAAKDTRPWVRLSDDVVARLKDALAHLSAEPRDQWLRMGMALKSTCAGDQAFALWNEWSQTCPSKYDAADCVRTWAGLREELADAGEVTIASLYKAAANAGWNWPSAKVAAPAATPETWKWKTDLDYLNSELLSPTWIVKRLIPASSVTLVFGPSMACKSVLVLDLALRVARGLPFCGRKVAKRASSVVFAGEGREGFDARFKAWYRAFEHPEVDAQAKRVYVLDQPVPDLALPESWERITQAVNSIGGELPGLVCVDTLSTCAKLEDENSNAAVAKVIALANEFAMSTGIGVIIVHHTRKGAANELGLDSARGAGAIGNNVSAAVQLRRDGERVTAYLAKMKDGQAEIEFVFRRSLTEIGHDEDGEPVTPPVLIFESETGKDSSSDDAVLICQAVMQRTGADPMNDSKLRFLARDIGLGDRRRFDAAVGAAQERGWLTVEGGGGRGKAKFYRLTSAAPLEGFGVPSSAYAELGKAEPDVDE